MAPCSVERGRRGRPQQLSAALASALQTDASVKAFNAMGFIPGAGTPGPMTKQIEQDMRLFTTVIRERNLKFDS